MKPILCTCLVLLVCLSVDASTVNSREPSRAEDDDAPEQNVALENENQKTKSTVEKSDTSSEHGSNAPSNLKERSLYDGSMSLSMEDDGLMGRGMFGGFGGRGMRRHGGGILSSLYGRMPFGGSSMFGSGGGYGGRYPKYGRHGGRMSPEMSGMMGSRMGGMGPGMGGMMGPGMGGMGPGMGGMMGPGMGGMMSPGMGGMMGPGMGGMMGPGMGGMMGPEMGGMMGPERGGMMGQGMRGMMNPMLAR